MEDNKRKLYDALSEDYDLGSFEQFSADIADETKRRKLYDAAIEDYDFGDFDSFSSQLGFGKTEKPSASTSAAAQPTAHVESETDNFDDEPDLRALNDDALARVEKNAQKEAREAQKAARKDAKKDRRKMTPQERVKAFNEEFRNRQQEYARRAPEAWEVEKALIRENDELLKKERQERRAAREKAARYGNGGEGYSAEDAAFAGEEYDSLVADSNALNSAIETYNKSGKGDYNAIVDKQRDIRARMDALMESPAGQEYQALTEQYKSLSEADDTPENRFAMAQVAGELSRNPLARASMGKDAPSLSQVDFDTNRAEVEYIESQMETADRAKKKELKARLKELNHEVLDNEYYQEDVERRIIENDKEKEDVYGRMTDIRNRVLKDKSKLESLDEALLAEPEYQKLRLAANQLEQTGRKLSHIRDKNANDFWVNFMDVFSDPNTYNFNITNLETALATKAASLSPEKSGSEDLLSAVAGANATAQEEGQFVESKGRYGAIAANSIPFMFQIGLTGGFSGVAEGVSGAVAKAAGKNADKFITKATGAVLGDLASGFVAANTIGAGKTMTDIVNNYYGTLQRGEDGTYGYVGGESLGRSVWGSEVGNTIEFASERAGDHMQRLLGRGILGWGINQAKKNGRGSVNVAVEELAKSMNVTLKDFGFRSANQAGANWAQKAMGGFVNALNKVGIQGYPFEVAEEYVGLLGNIILGGEEKWMDFSKLGDKETHTDIWGGMLYSIGLTQAGTVALGGVGAAVNGVRKAMAYHQLENALEANSIIAENLLGKENWASVKETIDGTTNKDLPKKITEYMDSAELDPQQKAAILDYAKDTYIYRGFNAGTIAQARERISSPENLLSLNIDAEVASAQDQISDAYMLGYQSGTGKNAAEEQIDTDRKSRQRAIDTIEQAEEIRQAVERQKARFAELTGIPDMTEEAAARLLEDNTNSNDPHDQEVRDAALDYLMAVAVEKGFADAEENRQIRGKADIEGRLRKQYGQFYYVDGMGDKVVESSKTPNPATKQWENVFLLSGTPNENGEVPFVSTSGRRGYVKREQLADYENDGTLVAGLTKTKGLNEFLDEQYAYEQTQREGQLAEQDAEQTVQREAAEAQQANSNARSIVESRIGEDGSFYYEGEKGTLIRPGDEGAVFVPEDGENKELTWDELMRGSETALEAEEEPVAEAPAEAPAEEPVEESEEESPKIPLDKNGNPVYDAPGVSVEDALADMYTTEGLDEADVDEYIIGRAKKAEEGRNVKQGNMSLKEWGQKKKEANRVADFWAELKSFADENKAAREREQKEEAERKALIEKYGVDTSQFDLTPQNLREAVADYLGRSEKIINLDDAIRETLGRRKDGRVPSEIFRHVGNGGLLTKKGGRSIADVANDIVGEFYNDDKHDSEQDAARDAIIEFLTNNTKTEMREFIFNQRLAEAKERAEHETNVPEEGTSIPETTVEEPVAEPVSEPVAEPVVEEPTVEEPATEETEEDLPEDTDGEETSEPEGTATEEQKTNSLTDADIIEIYNGRESTKEADKGKPGRKEIIDALYQANPQLVQFRNEQDKQNAISDVVELAQKYPNLAISNIILERVGVKPAEEPENKPENTGKSEEESVTSQEEEKVPGSPSEIQDAAGARAYFESLYGKGKKADAAVRVWELTHKVKPKTEQAGGDMQTMAMASAEGSGLSDEEASELVTLGTQLAEDYIAEDGFVKFPQFFKNLVETFGDGIRPFSKQIYLGASANVSDEIADQMDDRKAVRDFDTSIDINDISDEQNDTTGVSEPGQAVSEPVSEPTEGNVPEGEGEVSGTDTGAGVEDDNTEGAGEATEGGRLGDSGEGVSGTDERGDGENGGSGTKRGRGGRPRSGSRGGRTRGSDSVNPEPGEDSTRGLDPEKAAAEAEQKAYEAEKESIKDKTDINKLKSIKDELKSKISAITEKFDLAKAEMSGRLRAVIERLRELFSTNAKKTEALAQEKVPYSAVSDPTGEHAIGSVVPSGSADAMRDAIRRLEAEEGKTVAEFVKDELGYKTLDEMFSSETKNEGLSSEQVDSVGLAIHQMKKGKMFIIGDMTGIGKGRQGAALIRWAKRNGKKCLFVTEKPDLFSDMYQDLKDIGTSDLLPFIVNSDAGANITEKNSDNPDDKTILVRHPAKAVADNLYKSDSDELPEVKGDAKNKGKKYNFVMMTYSQAQGARTAAAQRKLDWIKKYAKDAIVICDESHNASGDSNRGKYFQGIVRDAQGVTFSSATFAKRPDNMVLYALRSSIGDVQMTQEDLVKAIQQYGIPMQEILAASLFKTGEMVRRERDFSDVKTHWYEPKEIYPEKEFEQSRATFDKSIEVVNQIIDFQRSTVDPIIKQKNEDEFKDRNAIAEAAIAMGGEGDIYEYTTTPYSSQVSNVAGLMFYSIKAQKAAEMAIEQIKKGEKPVIAVENTLESYLKDIDGDVKTADFAFVLNRGLGTSLKHRLKVTHKKYNPDTKQVEVIKEKSYVKELGSVEPYFGEAGKANLEAVEASLKAYSEDKTVMPLMLSPIDYIKKRIEDAGYKCGEITGRSLQLVQAPDGTWHTEPFKADKKKAISQFNGGETDALILNTAGSTGISLHASRRFKDQKKRNMIILQPARDPNTEVQIRGRVDRTGQVSRAEYFYITSPIPAEQKIIMMLRQKLASLDANSVGTENVSSNRVNADDMDNKYGDEVARQFLIDHPEINEQLDKSKQIEERKGEYEHREGLLYDLLVGIQRMTCEEQEMILNELQSAYKDQIEYLNQNGINDLATTTMNLEAVTIDSGLFIKGKDNESMSAFAHDTNIERVEVNVINKPLRSSDINARMKKLGALDEDGKIDPQYGQKMYDSSIAYIAQAKADRKAKYQAAEEKLENELREQYPKNELQTDEEYDKAISEMPQLVALKNKNQDDFTKFEAELDRQSREVFKVVKYCKPGMPMLVPLTDEVKDNAPMSFGRFIGFKIPKDGKPKGIKAVFAVKDSRASIEVPIISKADVMQSVIDNTYGSFGFGGTNLRDIGGPSYDSTITEEDRRQARDEWWDKMIPKDTNRQIRYMVTGNILQACGSLGKYKGTITTFTRKDPDTGEITVERGMLLAENFDPENFEVRSAVTKEDVWDGYDQIKDNITNIGVRREGNKMIVTFDRKGREKLSNHPIMKDDGFKALIDNGEIDPYSRDQLRAYVSEANVEKVLDYLYKNYSFTKGTLFVMPDSTEKVDKIVFTDKPYKDVIDDLEGKYGANEWKIENMIKRAVANYKMDVNNEDLKTKIRELVQLRQAYYRRRYAKDESSRLAWNVIIYDQRIENAKDDKDERDRSFAIREAIKEELAERGVHGNAMHFESGKVPLDTIVKTFNDLNKNKENAELAKRIFDLVKKLKLDVIFNEKIHNSVGGQTAGELVEYNWKYMNAEWITDQMKADTILHELVHTVTVYAKRLVDGGYEHLINEDIIDAVQQLDNIYRQIKYNKNFTHQINENGDSYTDYGVQDWFEMMAEAGSNENFRDDLKRTILGVKIMSGMISFTDVTNRTDYTGKTQTAYDAIKERLDVLLDNFSEHGFTEYFRGSMYGERSYNELYRRGSAENLMNPIDRARAISAVSDLAKKLGVKFKEDSSLDGKGAFNPQTGQIRINIDRHDGTADLEATLLHEAVAHYGLRKLLGKNFTNELKTIYNETTDAIREKIDAIATADGLSTEVATEEYLANLAEDGRFDAGEESFWQRVWYGINQLLRKLGFRTHLTDADMRALLYASYRNLQTRGAVAQAQHISTMYALRNEADASHKNGEDNPEDPNDGGGTRRYEPTVPEVDQEQYDNELNDIRSREADVLRTSGSESSEYKELKRREGDVIRRYLESIDPEHVQLNMVSTEGRDLEDFFEQRGDSRQQAEEDAKFVRMVRAYGYYDSNNDEITFFIENVRSIDFARRSYVHERQHHLTNAGNLDIQLSSLVNGDMDTLVESLAKITSERTASLYRTKYGEQPNDIANEIISHAMTHVFNSPTFANDMKNLQLADEIYDFIIRLADEQFSQAVRPAIQSRAYGSITNSGGNQNSESDDGRESGEVPGGSGRGSSGSFGLSGEGFNDLPEEVKQLAIEQETGELYRRSRNNATGQTAAQMYGGKVRTVGSAVKEVLVDELHPVDTLMEALAAESKKPIKDDERVSDMIRETGGKAMHAIRQYNEKFLKPMWSAVGEFRKRTGSSIKDTETYIGLKSGLERNVVLAKRDAKRDYQSEYDAEIEKINQEEKDKKKVLDTQLKTGKISDVTYAGDLTALQQEMKQKRDNAEAKRQSRFANVDAETDQKYKEYRKNDYSALTAWAETSDVKEAERLAGDYVSNMESKAGKQATGEVWKRINAATKETLRFQYEHQMLSRQQYSDISKMMEYYVPMRGFAEDTAEDLFNYYVTAQSNAFQPTVLTAKGRKTWYEGPLGNIGAMMSSAVSQGMKNEAKLSLLDAVRRRPNNTIATVTRSWFHKTGEKDENGKDIYKPVYPNIPEGATPAQREAIVERFEKDMAEAKERGDAYNSHREVDLRGGVVAFEREAHKNEHLIPVREGGKEYAIIINGNPAAAQAINGVKRGNGNGEKILGALRNMTRTLSSMFTTFSIPFWVSNFQRDHGQGLTNAFIRNNREYVGRYIVNRMKAAKLFPLILGKETMDNALAKGDPVAKLYKQYLENGGPMGQNRIEDNEYFERQMRRYLDNSAKQGIIKGAAAVFDVIGGVGEAIETITRFATFMTSMESGRSVHESISDAKEISTNFARKGSGRSFSRDEIDRMTHANGKPLTALEKGFVSAFSMGVNICRATIPFFNAAVQGLENKVTNYREHWGKTLAADAIYLMLGLGMRMLLGGAGGDDDKEKYAHTSDYLRRNNILMPLTKTKGVFSKWALPQEYRVMYALGDILAGAIKEERPTADAWIDAFGAVMQLSPWGVVTEEVAFSPQNKKKEYETLITNLSGGIAAPVLESIFNMDFKGARIYNEGFNENLKAYPGWTKALPTTGAEYVAAAKFLNELTGGNDVERGWVNINPAIVEHLVESYFSGPYQIIVRTPEAIVKGIKGDATVRDVPLLNRIILNTNDNQRDAYYSNMYYYFKELNTEANRINTEYKGRPKEGKVADFYNSKDYQYMLVFKKYDKVEKELRKASKLMDEKGDKEKKKEYDDRLQDYQYRIAKECLDIYFDRNKVK